MKELSYVLDKSLATPLYIQLYTYIKNDILNGMYNDNERIPSRRVLTESLGVNKNTVELAYHKLVADGYAVSKSRSGYFARRNSPINTDIVETNFYDNTGISYNMSQNGVDLASIPGAALTKILREVMYDSPELLEYGHKYGEKDLRQAIVHMLYEDRGIVCTPSQVIIGAGREYLLEQLVKIFDDDMVFGFENPCFARSYIPIKNSRNRSNFINSTIRKFDVSSLNNSNIDIMYLMPENRFPIGVFMSEKERKGICEWLNESDRRYVIEDDYDWSLCDDGVNKALFSIDETQSVIYIGSFSRTIAPDIEVSFIVVPDRLKKQLNVQLPYYTNLVSRFEQKAVSKYIQLGKYSRHIARLRTLYSEKRKYLLELLNESRISNIIEIINGKSGPNILITVKKDENEFKLKQMANNAGIKFIPLSACFINLNGRMPPNTFILGFGELSKDDMKNAVKLLEKAWVV